MTTSGRVLSIEGLSLRYSGATSLAVDDFSLEADRGEIITLLGPSGCGKTSALRLVAGLEQPGAGRVSLNGKDITGWAPELRRMGFVFQNYALFPHLTVGENVAFGLRIRRASRAEIDEAVRSSLALVNLEGFEDRRIDQLSGGQQQRVALARALAITPTVLLLDEPLSNLDASLREQTRDALRGVLRSLDITTLFVTHDQAEAALIADRIALILNGGVEQFGAPRDFYLHPATPAAAQFFGWRLIEGQATGHIFDTAIGSFVMPQEDGSAPNLIAFRPESLRLRERRIRLLANTANNLTGTVEALTDLGTRARYRIALPSGDRIEIEQDHLTNGADLFEPGATVILHIPSHATRFFRRR